jgi:NADH-quinone oxidoreductase subunit J
LKAFEIAFFALCAVLTFGGGIITVGSRRPIRSAMGLLATILGIAGCYLLLAAEFLAAVQLIVYAGAVVVLFIFVVMLLGSASVSPPDAGSAVPRYLGASVFLVAAVGAATLVIRAASEGADEAAKVADSFGTIEMIGKEIFNNRVVPFELTGALLLVAVVGALAVARGKHVDPTQTTAGTTPDGSTTDKGQAS